MEGLISSGAEDRVKAVLRYLVKAGKVRNASEFADALEVSYSTLSMAINGVRPPTLELLLAITIAFPVNFEWLRTGNGCMITGDAFLIERIATLELENENLRNALAAARQEVDFLKPKK